MAKKNKGKARVNSSKAKGAKASGPEPGPVEKEAPEELLDVKEQAAEGPVVQEGYYEEEIPDEQPAVSKPVALILSLVLIIAIVVVGYMFVHAMKNSLQTGEPVTTEIGGAVDKSDEPLPKVSFRECMDNHGWDVRTPVFSYLPSCPNCKNMIPRIMSVEAQGHPFTWVDRSVSKNSKDLYDCLGDVVRNEVPQIICPNTRKERIGVLTENEIRIFADECKNS